MAVIEVATPQQSERLARLARETFSDTFGHMYPPADLAAFLAKYTPAFFTEILANPAHRIWVARDGDDLIGYAHAGPCALPHPDVTPACGELKRLYVSTRAQGGGIGGLLLNDTFAWLSAPGRKLWIGVWSENFGAQRLYGRHGFHKVGEYEFIVGDTRDREFILRRD